MSPEQATELGKRIANCFRGTPPLAEWVDVFINDLTDYQAALETVRRLRYTEGALTVDRFAAEYDAVMAAGFVPEHLKPCGPRLTREQRIAILTRAGAPRHIVDPKASPL
jgi:hypothetical protein